MLTERHTTHTPLGMIVRNAAMVLRHEEDECIQRPSCALAGRNGYSRAAGHATHGIPYGAPQGEEIFDDVDEDDISDDEDLHQRFLMAAAHAHEGRHGDFRSGSGDNGCQDSAIPDPEQELELSDRLLHFSQRVNKDIHKLFGHRKDACNIYEDRWKRGKSGRELYYADLLRIAQGDDMEDKTYTGYMDRKLGLGPLRDLFEVRGRGKEGGRGRTTGRGVKSKAQRQGVPMKDRHLPPSFWKEPQQRFCGLGGRGEELQPDFTDLLESWGMVGSVDSSAAIVRTTHS